MCSERFYAEHFRRVMSAEQKIHAEFLSGNCSPMRRFARDERVDVIVCDPVNLRAGSAGHDADRARPLRTEIENFHWAIQRFLQFPNKVTSRQRCAHFQADSLTFFFQEWLRGFQSERGDELCVVTGQGMDIEREMGAVD